MPVILYIVGIFAEHHIYDMIGFKALLQRDNRLENIDKIIFGLDAAVRRTAIVTVATVVLIKRLSEVMQQHLATAYRRLCICRSLDKQLLAYLLLGHRLALHEFLHFLEILVRIVRKTIAFATIPARTARFLIISFERLRHVIVDHKTHIGLVYTHAERYRSDYDIDSLKQKRILIFRPRDPVKSGMIWQSLDIVYKKEFGQFLDLLAAQAVYDTRFAFLLFDKLDDIMVSRLCFGPHLVIKVMAVE